MTIEGKASSKVQVIEPARVLLWARMVVVVAMFCSFIITWPLWCDCSRGFPLVPAFGWLPFLPVNVHAFFLFIACALLVCSFFFVPKICTWCAIGLLATLCLLDQSRIQPWLFDYCVLLAVCSNDCQTGVRQDGLSGESACDESKYHRSLDLCRLVIIGTYIWAGIHKFNPRYGILLAWFVQPFVNNVPEPLLAQVAILSACFETLLGLALLFLPLRRWAAIGCLALHALILVCLGPLGHNNNFAVWPWNVALVVLDVCLFLLTQGGPVKSLLLPKTIRHAVVLLLFFILPVGSYLGFWAQNLSANLYAVTPPQAVLVLGASDFERLPIPIRKYCVKLNSGDLCLSLYDWSFDELKVPSSPEVPVLIEAARIFVEREHIARSSLVILSFPKYYGDSSVRQVIPLP